MPPCLGGAWQKARSRPECPMTRLKQSGFIHSNSPSIKVLANEAEASIFKAVLFNESSTQVPFPQSTFQSNNGKSLNNTVLVGLYKAHSKEKLETHMHQSFNIQNQKNCQGVSSTLIQVTLPETSLLLPLFFH